MASEHSKAAFAAISLDQIYQTASVLPPIHSSTPIKHYYDISDKMLKNAEDAHNTNQFELEYLWLLKFALMVQDQVKQHTEFGKSGENARLKKIYSERLMKHILPRLEIMKPELERLLKIKAEKRAEEEAKEKVAKQIPNQSSARSKPNNRSETSNQSTKTNLGEDESGDDLDKRFAQLDTQASKVGAASAAPRCANSEKPLESDTTLIKVHKLMQLTVMKEGNADIDDLLDDEEDVQFQALHSPSPSPFPNISNKSFTPLQVTDIDWNMLDKQQEQKKAKATAGKEMSQEPSSSSSTYKPNHNLLIEEDEDIGSIFPSKLDLSWLETDPVFGGKIAVQTSPSPFKGDLMTPPITVQQVSSSSSDSLQAKAADKVIAGEFALRSDMSNTGPSPSTVSPTSSKPPSYSSLGSNQHQSLSTYTASTGSGSSISNSSASNASSPSPTTIPLSPLSGIMPNTAPLIPPSTSPHASTSASVLGASAVSSAALPLPSSSSPTPFMEYSFTKTQRGLQFDPLATNRRLDEAPTEITATCSHHHSDTSHHLPHDHTSPTSSSSGDSNNVIVYQSSSSSSSSATSNQASLVVKQHGPSSVSGSGISSRNSSNNINNNNNNTISNNSNGNNNQQSNAAPTKNPFSSSSSASSAVSPLFHHPKAPTSLPTLPNGIPVVFRSSHLNIFDPSKFSYAFNNNCSPGGITMKQQLPYMGAIPSTSSVISQKQHQSSPSSSSSTSAANSSNPNGNSPRPPQYSTHLKSSSPKKKTVKFPQNPSTSPPPYKAASAGASSYQSQSSAFPLLTNQRPGAAVEDLTLRKVQIDGEMFDQFMAAAWRNTSRSIETCGILAGKLSTKKDVFRVTHLIIPKQTGTTDTCATINEEELFNYQLKNDLLTLGWIHTHPSQACFLSSVDLHTHSSYQALFKEAVAIVMAPRDTPSFAFFHLSSSGLETIQNCPKTGFHHHPERRLYEACSHVVLIWDSKKPCKIVDMR